MAFAGLFGGVFDRVRYADELSAPKAPSMEPADHPHIHTPQFKAWFGDWTKRKPGEHSHVVHPETGKPHPTHEVESSQVIKQGKPVTVYHGTGRTGFSSFDKKFQNPQALYGPGFYFTEDHEVANQFRNKIPPRTLSDESAQKAAQFLIDFGNVPDHEKADLPRRIKALHAAKDHEWAIQNWNLTDKAQGWYHDQWRSMMDNPLGEPGIIPVFLNIRQPLDMDAASNQKDANKIASGFESMKEKMDPKKRYEWNVYRSLQDAANDIRSNWHKEASVRDLLARAHKSYIGTEQVDAQEGPSLVYRSFAPADYQNILQHAGYDGITHMGGSIMGDRPHRVWIAFEPNQIKHARQNRGTYDPNDHRIHYAEPLFDGCFGGVFVVR